MSCLTPRQASVASAIRNYRHVHGYSPTLQELADTIGISKKSIFDHVAALEAKGIIRRDKFKARSIEIIADERLPDEARPTKLPMLGVIAAGSPIAMADGNAEAIDLEQLFRSAKGVYVLRVRGASMAAEHYADGDHLIVERRQQARNGERVVVILENGAAAVREFRREAMGGAIVQGVLLGMIRGYR